ncbi:MAG: GntR family transcriptional regulator [Rhodobacteraceae bacterium]|nr:GntR family transcriptional regulator [Paracoccaceae bacterium]
MEEPLHELVYQQLKWSMIVGDYVPNEAISIRSVATRWGTSTTPVREAIKRLISERAISSSGNKTFRIRRMEPKQISDLFFLRSSLEGIATELATPHMTKGQIDRLDELAREMDEFIDASDYRSYLSHNYSFHFTIYGAASNAELVSMIEGLWAQTGPFLAAGARRAGMSEDWRLMHRKIVGSIRSRDAGLARQLIERDVGWGIKVYGSLDSAPDASST